MSVPQILRDFFKYSPLPFLSLGQHCYTNNVSTASHYVSAASSRTEFLFPSGHGTKIRGAAALQSPSAQNALLVQLHHFEIPRELTIFSRVDIFLRIHPSTHKVEEKQQNVSICYLVVTCAAPIPDRTTSTRVVREEWVAITPACRGPYQFPFSYCWEKGPKITKNSAARHLPICLT